MPQGLRADAHLGRRTNPDPKTSGSYDRYDRDSEALGTPRVRDAAEAIEWLSDATNQAGGELRDEFPANPLPKSRITFAHLGAVLEPREQR